MECGVWRGGNSIIAADVFKRLDPERQTYLFDTFAGMTAPTDLDVNLSGSTAMPLYEQAQKETYNELAYSPL